METGQEVLPVSLRYILNIWNMYVDYLFTF